MLRLSAVILNELASMAVSPLLVPTATEPRWRP